MTSPLRWSFSAMLTVTAYVTNYRGSSVSVIRN